MIDAMENKVLGPMIRQGMTKILQAQLERRFGTLPSWVNQELQDADIDTLQRWSVRVLDAPSLEEVFQ